MKNIIEFYYNIKLNNLHAKEGTYFFSIGRHNYLFIPYNHDSKLIDDIYKLNSSLVTKTNIDLIIKNKYNSPLTIFNNNPYILILKRGTIKTTLQSISFLANLPTDPLPSLERHNWEILWGNRIDYLEMQINENAKKYPLIRESVDYFIGLGETAIAYLVNTKNEVAKTPFDKKVLSHASLHNSLSNPLNIIFDHQARDLAEYIKLSFFNNNQNIFNELDLYFNYNYFSLYGIRVLYSRILYPNFYFDLYDNIISGTSKEESLNPIINRINDYEIYLYNIFLYLRKYYDIPEIDWLKKRGFNPHLQP